MRGVISLAAAIALPHTFKAGSAFAQRNMIIFLAFSAILVTLVLQGLTLPPLIRALGLTAASGSNSDRREEQDARRAILNAALQYLDNLRDKAKPEVVAVYDDLSQGYRSRLASLSEEGILSRDGIGPGFYKQYVEVYRKLLKVQRQTAVRLRNERRINDELLRELQRELDLSESRFTIQGT
jgi:CPA1 family monovalent cation:H+ antiporter